MRLLYTLTILILALLTNQLDAQNVRAHLVFGTNLTEANLTKSGNSQVGFRMGLNSGAGVSVKVSERLRMGLELLYSQNGLYVQFVEIPAITLDKITLHYFEAPIYLLYPFNISQRDKKKRYKQSLSAGVNYAHLFNHKIIGVGDTVLTNDVRFNKNNTLLFNITAKSLINEHFAVDGRVTIATFGNLTFAFRLLYFI